jgi:hypothetical protein
MPTEHPKDTHKFFSDVYLAELDYVKKRRAEMDIPSDTVVTEIERVRELKKEILESETSQLNVTSAKTGLVGLALSGGGVRSATFNLGLLQSLAKNKVLQYCDYLSTVSGGGYIGACLTSLLADNKDYSTKKEAFPFRETDSKTLGERPEVNHLRATKNYLGLGSSGGFSLDIWHMSGTMISGLLLMSLIPLALILSLVLLLYFIPPFFEVPFFKLPLSQVVLGLVIVFVSLTLIWMVIIRFRLTSLGFSDESHIRHNKRIARRAAMASLLVMASLVIGMIYGLAWTYVGQPTVFVYILGGSLLMILVGLLSTSHNKFQRTLIKVIMSLALTVFACVLFSWLLSFGYTSVRLKTFESVLEQIKTGEQKLVQSGDLKQNLFLFKSPPTENEESWFKWFNNFRDWMRDEIEETTEEKRNNALKLAEKDARFLLKVWQLIQAYGLTQLIKQFDEETFVVRPLREEYGEERIAALIEVMRPVQEKTLSIKLEVATPIGIAIIILLLVGMLININRNSLHYFYRDRLSNTYMIKWGKEGIEPNSSLRLKDIHQYCNGPYHLINTTLNVPYSRNSALSGRGADFFVFSKYYCGAESTGYRTTTSYDQGKTRVATAMAISGAAASPEMGKSTNPIMLILMTLLNTRLNLWMPNPNHEHPPKLTFWPQYLLKELFRKGTENDTLINLSDGGHHENLGIYPLLKRRCRVIIASDAGADSKFEMTDLANLQRKARIDLGINITIDLTDLRPDLENNRYTQAHFVKGTIHYPDDESGTLLYIKTTLTGEEPEDLLAYRRMHASFPDETTADQFFDEDQFESYRKLGELSGDAVFSKENAQGVQDLSWTSISSGVQDLSWTSKKTSSIGGHTSD